MALASREHSVVQLHASVHRILALAAHPTSAVAKCALHSNSTGGHPLDGTSRRVLRMGHKSDTRLKGDTNHSWQSYCHFLGRDEPRCSGIRNKPKQRGPSQRLERAQYM